MKEVQRNEEENFKDEFKALNDCISYRHNLKIGINEAKHSHAASIKFNSSLPATTKNMKRVTSQAVLKNNIELQKIGKKLSHAEVQASKAQKGFNTIKQLTEIKNK